MCARADEEGVGVKEEVELKVAEIEAGKVGKGAEMEIIVRMEEAVEV